MKVIKILRITGRTPIKNRMIMRKRNSLQRTLRRQKIIKIKERVRIEIIRAQVVLKRISRVKVVRSLIINGIQVVSLRGKIMMTCKEARASPETERKAPPSPRRRKKMIKKGNSRGAEDKQEMGK